MQQVRQHLLQITKQATENNILNDNITPFVKIFQRVGSLFWRAGIDIE
jgi:hypothetical protein